ncbi:MAG: DGQHR domain-containing protein [Phreatobacter sp.]|uniref:DGQHR domain-containing protein n=1 Tax=Phreatobacter sp. TaxID=1966341 RepID=UPI0027370FA4|nr:DGQHR domain-containing protein [Phreatobacter sp.]MDP2803791.1 DGQHR domain-containing protein [Phreatobacter sp.]
MIKLHVLQGVVLGVEVLRGFAKLSDLARISRADVYDEKNNPLGTQRDLSPKHAREAYEYARSANRGYWPEVLLCVRDGRSLKFTPMADGFGTLEIDDVAIQQSSSIAISRIDGNHRLHFADGQTAQIPKLDRIVSFCIALDVGLHEEIALFRDINNNQKRMDTSHLDKIEIRLSGEEAIKSRNPPLYIANRLANDSDSPISIFVYQGGKRPPGAFIPLKSIHTGIEYMMSRQTRLTAIGDIDAQLVLIKNYFRALSQWVPEAWEHHKDYLLLRGAGFWGTCFLGAEIIDRVVSKKKHSVEDMLAALRSGRTWNWHRNGDFQGYSGRGGAVKIADKIIRELKDEQGMTMHDLLEEILKPQRSS